MKISSRQRQFEPMRTDYSVRSGSLIGIFFFIFFNMKVCCVFSLESPHRGDSNEYTQYTISNMNKKNTLNIQNLQLWAFFQRTQEGVRNSRGKQAISGRAIEVLLYCGNVYGKYQLFLEIFGVVFMNWKSTDSI